MNHYQDFEFALFEQPGEIREPASRYDLRLPHEEIEDVMSLDLRGLDPEDTRNPNLDRRLIDGLVDAVGRLLQLLRKALAAFQEKYSAARRRARRRR